MPVINQKDHQLPSYFHHTDSLIFKKESRTLTILKTSLQSLISLNSRFIKLTVITKSSNLDRTMPVRTFSE